ncbi:MAG: glutathione synthase [Alphaproteobacteria bacterium]|nr:glutathione synthase [Alphaproteobacteria bacterium]MBU0859050.1 glutathione synthase [Alphaproteobacteria bacterium]
MSKQSLNIGVVMDPIARINPAKDTTLAMMLAAQSMGARLSYMLQDGLYIKDGQARARMRTVTVFDNAQKWYEEGEVEDKPLATLDLILMRKDPPVDKRFIHACYVLEQAVRNGVKVSNNPLALIDFNEKIFATHFPQYCPPYVISSDREVLREFLKQHDSIVIKPLDSMGGDGVFLVRRDDVNFEVIWEIQTQRGTYPVVAQAFIPEINKGDKRVVIFGGKPYGHALVRLPKAGSIRGNLAAGGSYEVRPLTPKEQEIAETVGRTLMAKGIAFAGLDIIGNYLTEVNITSPTGLRQLAAGTGDDVAGMLMRSIISN